MRNVHSVDHYLLFKSCGLCKKKSDIFQLMENPKTKTLTVLKRTEDHLFIPTRKKVITIANDLELSLTEHSVLFKDFQFIYTYCTKVDGVMV